MCRGTQLSQPLTRRERPWGLSHPSRGCPPSSLRRCPLHPVGLSTLQPRGLSPLSRGMPSIPSPVLSCPSRGSAPPHPPFLPSASRGGSVPSLYPQCNGVPVKWTGKFGWGGGCVRVGQGRTGGAGAGQDPREECNKVEGCHCRQGCPCLWAPAPASCQETLLCPGTPQGPACCAHPTASWVTNPTEIPCSGMLGDTLAVPMVGSGAQTPPKICTVCAPGSPSQGCLPLHAGGSTHLCCLDTHPGHSDAREDGKGICLLFPSSSFLGRHEC